MLRSNILTIGYGVGVGVDLAYEYISGIGMMGH